MGTGEFNHSARGWSNIPSMSGVTGGDGGDKGARGGG